MRARAKAGATRSPTPRKTAARGRHQPRGTRLRPSRHHCKDARMRARAKAGATRSPMPRALVPWRGQTAAGGILGASGDRARAKSGAATCITKSTVRRTRGRCVILRARWGCPPPSSCMCHRSPQRAIGGAGSAGVLTHISPAKVPPPYLLSLPRASLLAPLCVGSNVCVCPLCIRCVAGRNTCACIRAHPFYPHTGARAHQMTLCELLSGGPRAGTLPAGAAALKRGDAGRVPWT